MRPNTLKTAVLVSMDLFVKWRAALCAPSHICLLPFIALSIHHCEVLHRAPVRHSWKHITSASIWCRHWRSSGCRSCHRSITPRRLKVATEKVALVSACRQSAHGAGSLHAAHTVSRPPQPAAPSTCAVGMAGRRLPRLLPNSLLIARLITQGAVKPSSVPSDSEKLAAGLAAAAEAVRGTVAACCSCAGARAE